MSGSVYEHLYVRKSSNGKERRLCADVSQGQVLTQQRQEMGGGGGGGGAVDVDPLLSIHTTANAAEWEVGATRRRCQTGPTLVFRICTRYWTKYFSVLRSQ